MAVAEQTPYIEYTANGATTNFSLGFDCESKDHLIVTVDGVEPLLTDWSLVDGAVVFVVAPINESVVVIQRNTPFARPVDYQTYNNSLRAPAFNNDFDRIWLKLQELGTADWALRQYVDKKDNELRAFLLAEIQAQGVSLDQLEAYYNYLMQRLAEIAINRGWMAEFVIDATGRTQQEINDAIIDPTTGNAVASKVYDASGKTQQEVNDDIKSKVSRYPTILDYFTQSELENFAANPTMDLTAIIKRAFATGVKKLNFLDLQMHISQNPAGDTLVTFASGDIELFGNGAKFIDTTTYLNNNIIVPLFTLNGGVNSFKSNIGYVGNPVNLTTDIGYVGATYVYSKRVNKNISLDVYLENIRYGILAGAYADETLGGTKTIRGKLDCNNVGYPIASYLADDIELKITGDGFHRVHYIAGCNHARINARTKNYYIAPIACLYTDAKTGTGTSRGCTDCKTTVIDQGSTAYVANGFLSGISLSRVDPNTVFDDITLDATVIGTDTIASKLGHSVVNSSVRTVQPSYPTNWTSDIYIKRLKIRGLVDRSKQTTEEHASGEVYISPIDDVTVPGAIYSATVSDFDCSDLVYRGGSGAKPRGFWFRLDGLTGNALFRNVYIPDNAPVLLRSNTTSETLIENCKLKGLDVGNNPTYNSKVSIVDSEIYGGETYLPRVNKTLLNTKVGANKCSTIQMKSTDLVLSGASTSWANAMPVNTMVLGISYVITETIIGTSGFFIGDGTTTSKFISTTNTSVGQGGGLSNMQVGSVPYITPGTGSIVLTARDSGGGTAATFTSGKVKLVIHYITIDVPAT